MKNFIIGNGFDMKHGLPTSYWDFRSYLEYLYPQFLYSFEEHYSIYPRTGEQAKRELLWNQLETNLANIDDVSIIENALHMDLGLESGDIGIYDTLHTYFRDEYKYINELARYLKQWVRTIKIKGVPPKTTFINKSDDAIYITFNYTAVLETVYGINPGKITHIHGSLRDADGLPVLGHGNQPKIDDIHEMRQEAERDFDEKGMSIYRVLGDYYNRTFKDINLYKPKLQRLKGKPIDEIIVIGHSVAGVDLPYFEHIDTLTMHKAKWKVHYFRDWEKQLMNDSLIECGIQPERIEIRHADDFYNL
ncbi:bacteriophage abortive infection AbiH family protein [Paenibacillus enshidis]|uniref:Bacteriophage abortive infection AbiH family protein n=1 Tax=Paenibacillus enshidis TaxID=1458439 RepID=A0ABV5B122_9BACL